MSRTRRAAPATRPKLASPTTTVGMAPWLVAALLALVVLVVYGRVSSFDFIHHYDDTIYVTGNPQVLSGITPASLAWSLTQPCAGNWHPLTMMSHMLDVQLFGVTAGRHHLVNILFHVVNTLLLFWVLWVGTQRPWPSLFVAGVFALHPMHVESVAWIAERKDVLSTFFWLLTIAAYFRYVRARSVPRYALTMVFLGAGLMAKPMLVTLPLVLVLLDFWPLKRFSGVATRGQEPRRNSFTLRQSLVEKLPMLALVLVFIAVTIATQQQIGAVSDAISRPLGLRIANALVAYSVYLLKLFVPVNLAVFYPYPTAVPVATVAGACVLLLGITWGVWAMRRRAPYALTGWLWFAGTLVPVIGIVQVGSQSMADRYSYVPHIGLAIAVAFGVADLMRRWRVPSPAEFGLAAGILCVLSWLSWRQLEYWKDATHLFQHAIAVTQGNFIAHNNYGAELLDQKQVDEAITQFERAVAVNPTYQAAVYNLGLAYQTKGRYDDSARTLERALALNPADGRSEYRLAVTLALQQKYPDALPHYDAAVRLAPEAPEIRESYSNALNNYGSALGGRGEYREAMKMFERALELKPDNESARQNLTYTRQAIAAGSSH